MSDYSLLFVDDDEELLDTFCIWFTRRGFHVAPAHHPRQALSAVSRRDFDVAVLDATLPEMSGLELMERLKGLSDMPVIMLSGINDRVLQDDAIERGIYRYLLKPTSMRQLEEIIHEAINEKADSSSSKATHLKNLVPDGAVNAR